MWVQKLEISAETLCLGDLSIKNLHRGLTCSRIAGERPTTWSTTRRFLHSHNVHVIKAMEKLWKSYLELCQGHTESLLWDYLRSRPLDRLVSRDSLARMAPVIPPCDRYLPTGASVPSHTLSYRRNNTYLCLYHIKYLCIVLCTFNICYVTCESYHKTSEWLGFA